MELVVAGNVNVSQNLTVNTSVLFVDGTSGRVGINTITPTKALHVIGDVNISGRLDVGTLNITGVTFGQGDITAAGSLIVNGGANITGDLGVNQQLNITAGSGNLVTAGTIGVSGTGDSYILGNVGIGTTTPVNTLEVSGNMSVHNISIRTTGGTGALIFHNGSGICIGSC